MSSANFPKISVVIPVYGVEKYLQNCIDSLLGQTLDEMELIFVNDCSPDNSLKILYENQQRNPDKIVIINSKENLRQGGARNLGIKAAKAEYLGFVDGDDYVHPEMYRLLLERVIKANAEAAYGSYQKVEEGADLKSTVGKIFCNEEVPLEMLDMENRILTDEDRMKLMLSHQYGSVWGGIYRRSVILENSILFPERLAYEDNYWVYLLQMYLKSVVYVPKACYFYRQQNNSTVHKRNAGHQFDRIPVGQLFLQAVKDRELYDRYYEIIEYLFLEVFTYNTYSLFLKRFDKLPIKEVKSVTDGLRKEFPKWEKNRFYREQFNLKKKLKAKAMMNLSPKCVKMISEICHF